MPSRVFLAMLITATLSIAATVHAQTREETLDYLFSGSDVNGVSFYSFRVGDQYEIAKYFKIVEDHQCVVTVSDTVSGNTGSDLNGDLATTFDGKPNKLTVEFNKLIMNTAVIKKLSGSDSGKVEITVSGLPDAVHGIAFGYYGEGGTMVQNFAPFSNDYLKITFDEEKSPKASNAFAYFVQNFCSGSHRSL